MRRCVSVAAAVLLTAACGGGPMLEESDADVVLSRHVLDAPDPGVEGDHEVRTLYYGSGTDRHRPEYGDSVNIRTPSVDGSALVDLGNRAEERNDYWGFTPEEMPLNARVWYPDGPGPFPLVLVVHGNHSMKDFSDPGYEYLGQLLASRGFILASVDQNFINGAIRGENDGRGWLLLKHLELWREWNGEAGHVFQGKVDLERIALMGHSRGGEAVGHAAAFNRLTRYPDDASVTFDFGFGIRSVVAIAPVDGQYLPADQPVPVRDVNYLVFHGSHDGDVTSFHGLRQFGRVRFTGEGSWFKSAVYVYRANHGQWNQVWGAHDRGPRSGRILDLDALMPARDQRRFAEVYVSAFLEATLNGRDEYLPLFRDHRVAGEWLPPTMYVTRLYTSGFRPVATFEEDIDVTSGTAEGVSLAGEGLAVWKEGKLLLRSRNRSNTSRGQERQAVWLGWNRRTSPGNESELKPAPSYTVTLPAGMASRWGVHGGWTLDLNLAPTENVPPLEEKEDGSDPEDAAEEGDAAREPSQGDSTSDPAPSDDSTPEEPDTESEAVDLTVEVVDASGVTARVPLSSYGPIRRPLKASILRRKDLEEERYPQLYDLVLQSYTIPLSDFGGGFDPGSLVEVRLVFDRAVAGEVALDDVGLTDMRPAFLRDRIPAPSN